MALPGFDALPNMMRLSFLTTFFQWTNIANWLSFLLLGSVVESGRTLYAWLMERIKFRYSITANFSEGDQIYDWVVHYLTEKQLWRQSRDFKVKLKTLKRRWAVKSSAGVTVDEYADYVPTFHELHLFRWNGCWLEMSMTETGYGNGTLNLRIYTLDMDVLGKLIAEARKFYHEVNKPHVNIHTTDSSNYDSSWGHVKRKLSRPLSSLSLPAGVIEQLVNDTQKFLQSEQWYQDMSIPYRRGYLLYGPPGTGKSSTIFALAGELGLEIYAISLSGKNVDDSFLSRASAALPKHCIFLIEDIDCAFPTRSGDNDDDEDDEDDDDPYKTSYESSVTLSGLLNVIDGVGSEEGRLFFATTNHIDRLDEAFIRPGRIDLRIEYFHTNPDQVVNVFRRFFTDASEDTAKYFASRIPKGQFSTAQLQGFLLLHRSEPQEALDHVDEWVSQELKERKAKEEREEKRKERRRQKAQDQQKDAIMAAAGAIAMANAKTAPASEPVENKAAEKASEVAD